VLVSHDLEEAVYLSDRILLLSRHPARAVEFVHYDAPRPRTDKTLSEADFISTKAHCLEIFQHEYARHETSRDILAVRWRRRAAGGVVAHGVGAGGRSVLLPSPIATFKAMWSA